MGTRELWQSTNQTDGHGSQHSGRGSARRVREFRIGSDIFATLGRGEAVIYTPLAGEPARAQILPVELAENEPARIDPAGSRHACEVGVHPEDSLPDLGPKQSSEDSAGDRTTTTPGGCEDERQPRIERRTPAAAPVDPPVAELTSNS